VGEERLAVLCHDLVQQGLLRAVSCVALLRRGDGGQAVRGSTGSTCAHAPDRNPPSSPAQWLLGAL